LAVSLGALVMALDHLWRRRLEDVTAIPSQEDLDWLTELSQAIDNDRMIIAGYLRNVVELLPSDPEEAARRLGLAREQVEQGAVPDFEETLEEARRLLKAVPTTPEPRPWPAAGAVSDARRGAQRVAAAATSLALTSRGRTRIRLQLVVWCFLSAARDFVTARVRVGPGFEKHHLPGLTRAAEELHEAHLELARVTEALLFVRARRDRWVDGLE
jgi:hypothetical protein